MRTCTDSAKWFRVLLLFILIFLPVYEVNAAVFIPTPLQTASRYQPGFINNITLTTGAATGTLNLQCNGATCPAGIYQLNVTTEIIAANTTQTSPNFTLTLGWTSFGGASKTSAPTGISAQSTATTNGVANATLIVNTTGALTYALTLSGSTGSQSVKMDIAAVRLR